MFGSLHTYTHTYIVHPTAKHTPTFNKDVSNVKNTVAGCGQATPVLEEALETSNNYKNRTLAAARGRHRRMVVSSIPKRTKDRDPPTDNNRDDDGSPSATI